MPTVASNPKFDALLLEYNPKISDILAQLRPIYSNTKPSADKDARADNKTIQTLNGPTKRPAPDDAVASSGYAHQSKAPKLTKAPSIGTEADPQAPANVLCNKPTEQSGLENNPCTELQVQEILSIEDHHAKAKTPIADLAAPCSICRIHYGPHFQPCTHCEKGHFAPQCLPFKEHQEGGDLSRNTVNSSANPCLWCKNHFGPHMEPCTSCKKSHCAPSCLPPPEHTRFGHSSSVTAPCSVCKEHSGPHSQPCTLCKKGHNVPLCLPLQKHEVTVHIAKNTATPSSDLAAACSRCKIHYGSHTEPCTTCKKSHYAPLCLPSPEHREVGGHRLELAGKCSFCGEHYGPHSQPCTLCKQEHNLPFCLPLQEPETTEQMSNDTLLVSPSQNTLASLGIPQQKPSKAPGPPKDLKYVASHSQIRNSVLEHPICQVCLLQHNGPCALEEERKCYLCNRVHEQSLDPNAPCPPRAPRNLCAKCGSPYHPSERCSRHNFPGLRKCSKCGTVHKTVECPCTVCGEQGHNKDSCPINRVMIANSGQASLLAENKGRDDIQSTHQISGSDRSPERRSTCEYCGTRKHSTSDCFVKKRHPEMAKHGAGKKKRRDSGQSHQAGPPPKVVNQAKDANLPKESVTSAPSKQMHIPMPQPVASREWKSQAEQAYHRRRALIEASSVEEDNTISSGDEAGVFGRNKPIGPSNENAIPLGKRRKSFSEVIVID